MKDINVINDNNKIDLFSLNKFLLSKEDNFLEYLLLENNLIFGLDENKIRNFILKGYKPLKVFYNNIKIDIELKLYLNMLLKFEEIKFDTTNNKFELTNLIKELFDSNNKYISIDGLVKYNSLFIKYIPENLLTQEICNKLYDKNNRNIIYLPNKFKTYEMCKKVIERYQYFFVYLPDPLDNDGTLITVEECYSLLKLAYNLYTINYPEKGADKFWSNASISKLDRGYFVRLMYEVNAQEYVGKYGQGGVKKNINLQENNSLLKEDNNKYVSLLEFASRGSQIDLSSLNNFLISKDDNFLEYLLISNGYSDNVDENKIRQYVLKNYVINENLLKYITKDKELYDFCETMVELKKVFYTGDIIKKFDKNTKLPKDFYNNKYFTFERLLKNYIYNFQFIDENDLTQEICDLAVSIDYMLFRKVPTRFKTYEMCKKVITSFLGVNHDLPYPHMFEDSLITEEECYSLIKMWYKRYYVNSQYSDENEFWLTHRDIHNFKYFPKKYYIRLINDFNLYSEEFIKKYEIDFYNNTLNESKSLLKEGITDEVYHFTTYQSAAEILQYNRFKFSIETEGDSLSRMNNYKNYMSVSRTKSLNKGFFNTIKNGVNLVIRFKLDGRKLAQKYKGIPFNYFPAWGKENYAFEYEDRLLSNDEYIENFSKYLLSVDIIDLSLGNDINKTKIHGIKELCQRLNLVCNVYNHDDNRALRKVFQSDPINFIKNKGTFLLNDSFFTKEVFNKIYKHFKEKIYTYISLSLIPAEFRSYELCELYIKNNPINIVGVPLPNTNLISREQYMSLVRLAFSLDKDIIGYIPTEFEKIFRDEINKARNNLQESKSLLKEGITDEVYHFTTLENFIKIMNTNTFRFSDLLYDLNDIINNTPLKKYKYYMSLSRTGSIKTGYGNYQSDNSNFIVRLKIDGKKLSQTYKGQPINYHNYGRKQKSSKKTNFRFEYEDRILSNKPTIENFSNYVLSVDIIKITNSSNNFLLDDDMKSLEYIIKNKENYNAPINFTNEKNSPLNESKSLLKEDYYTEEEVLEEISDKHKIDLDSLNKFLLKKKDLYLEKLLFHHELLNLKENIISLSKNKNIRYGEIERKYLFNVTVLKNFFKREPNVLNILSEWSIQYFNKDELLKFYKTCLMKDPFLLRKMPENFYYFNELMEFIYQNNNRRELVKMGMSSSDKATSFNKKVIEFLMTKQSDWYNIK
jgi:hypothetical protein